MIIVKPWNMSTEQKLFIHVSRLKIWSKRRKRDSENTYSGKGGKDSNNLWETMMAKTRNLLELKRMRM